MKADQIIRNAKIFTANKNTLQATALVVKDGKFIYVGDEAGLSAYEGEVTDLDGKFIMPGIIDTHVHVTTSIGFAYMDPGEYIFCSSKKEALDFMAESIKNNPGLKRHSNKINLVVLKDLKIVQLLLKILLQILIIQNL